MAIHLDFLWDGKKINYYKAIFVTELRLNVLNALELVPINSQYF